MKISLLVFSLIVLAGCGDPFAACQGLSGDDMNLCIAKANATMAWRRDVGRSLQAWGQQQQSRTVTCQAVGYGVVQCY